MSNLYMEIIFMNAENSNFVLTLLHRLDLRSSIKRVALQNFVYLLRIERTVQKQKFQSNSCNVE